jgi:hypothetical protein
MRWSVVYAGCVARAVPLFQACGRSESLQGREFMAKILWCLRLPAVFSVLLTVGCSSSNNPTPVPASGSYQVVTLSDVHFNPLYDTSLYSSLMTTDASGWAGVFEKSNVKLPTGGNTDTNYPLLTIALKNISQHMGNSPVVLITGDLLGHYIPERFYCANAGQPFPCSVTPSPAAIAAMPTFVDKTFTFVAGEIRAAVGSAMIIYVPGNIDTYQIQGAGPDPSFLAANAGTVYDQLLAGNVNQGTFLSTFASGGYYAAQPLGPQLLVIGLNTNSFVDASPTSGQAETELGWLNSQLASAHSLGQKVWILMHVPPGANSQGMKAITPGELDDSNVQMNWDQGYQSTFMSTLERYSGDITLMLAGHTHMDEYRLLPSGNVLEQLPGISPCFGNNPAFKILTITQGTFFATDYQSYGYDLSVPQPTQFENLYTFSTTYSAQGSLNTSLQQLYPQFSSDPSTQAFYTYFYTSGSTGTNPLNNTKWNPINSDNWPIFSCTVGEMDQSSYIQCVNTY